MATDIKLGLNRLGYPIWVRERDAPDRSDLKAYHVGVERAAFVVVLETDLLRGSDFARGLLEWAEEVPMLRPRFITVQVEPGDRTTEHGPDIPVERSTRRLVHKIDLAMQRAQQRRIRPFSAPEGKRGRYVLLSYASADADKAAALRQSLAEMEVAFWDYAVCPRDATTEYQEEIGAAIAKARTVLCVLTAAWLRSEHCRSELDRAWESGRRCVWLRFGPAKPPVDCEPRDLVEFRGPNGRVGGFAQLAHLLGG